MKILAQKKVLFLFGFLALLFLVLLIHFDSQLKTNGGFGYVNLQFTYTLASFEKIMTVWGDENRHLFLHTMWLDYFFPFFYAALLSGFLIKKGWGKTAFLPFMAALLDYVENSLEIYVVSVYPQSLFPHLIFISSLAASLKWALILASFTFLAVKIPALHSGENALD